MTGSLRPLVIMVLVITEVGLWQWRVILTGRGAKGLPTVLGIIGAILQITAIAQVVAYVQDPLTVAAYALGVGGGVLIGVTVGNRFTAEAVGVNVLTRQPELDSQLRARGWPVTSYEGRSENGVVHLLQIVVDPRARVALLADVTELAPQAFWTTENVQPGPGLGQPRLSGRPGRQVTPRRRLTAVTVGQH
ncbi:MULTISPECIES: DUF5698 domain-containing protein [Pseudofrankia]|uniref:DUF5698 domain-containing protein n=1 Tax=Pseudofrankia TaxID=2994363 RepID=UPI000234C123|nr:MULTISPECIES: DUF5698 domain-containing protein [Pseudofrankia]OHV33571.1 hypothetical protein BCD49_26410 [Pseudofrankia sp. EUN1h]